MNLKEILNELGAVDEFGNVKIDRDDPILYHPITVHPGGGRISDISYFNNRIFAEIKYDTYTDLYVKMDWDGVQKYAQGHFSEIKYDAKGNCWFVPVGIL